MSPETVDVSTEAVIRRPVEVVAAYAADPTNAPEWYKKIGSVEWRTSPPLQAGTQVTFVARFLRRTLIYTYRVTDYVPNERLVMETAEGPFPMQTVYEWEPLDDRSTRMTLRNVGSPSGFSRILAPVMATAIRRANRKDLASLRSILTGR